VFAAHKRPERERFAITVSRETQLLWLDPPDGPRWHLPRSAP
jgi:hypothetical protein